MQHRTRLIRVVIVLAALSTAIAARADIREASEPLVDRALERAIDNLDTVHIGMSAHLNSDRDLLVFCTVGGAYCDIRALARPTVAPSAVAQALERTLSETPLQGTGVEWAKEDDWSAARACVARGRIGATAGATIVPLGKLVSGLRAAGFAPHVVLRIPRHIATLALAFPQNLSGRNYAWYNASGALPDLAPVVSARLRPEALALSILFFALVPTAALSSLLLGLVVGSWKTIPIERRRRLYLRVVRWPTFGAIALHAPFVLFYFRSSACRTLSDLWFGSSSITALMPFVMGPLFLLVFVLPLSMVVERKLFGVNEMQKAIEAQISPEERAFRTRLLRWLLVPMLAGILIIFGSAALPHRRGIPVVQIALLCGIVVMHGGAAIVRRAFRREAARFEVEVGDEALTARAEELAHRMGVALVNARVQETPAGRLYIQAYMRPGGRLLITRKALEELTPAELDFVLAHELAHLQRRHLRRHGLLFLGASMLVVLPLALLPLRLAGVIRFPGADLFFVGSMLGMGWMFIGARRLRQRQEYESDRLALEATHDLHAAESALTKMMRCSPLPDLHEIDDLSTHPRVSRRLQSLRTAAHGL